MARELSGITPSGALTLGNYLGALRRFRTHQDDGYYFVADLHALTTEHAPDRLRHLTRSTAALFLASGLDPRRATVFVQSDVAAHVELAYLLECTAYVGELGRMIQFKEKGGRPATRASLFTYPCLMAADILLYDAHEVPVGTDQSQHVELARDLALRFNATYGETFVVPRLVPGALATRVADLADPTRKMSKSGPDDAPGVIRMLDTPDAIRRKLRRAVTDSDGELRYDPVTKPGLANLADILATLTRATPKDVLADQRGYGALKDACADAVIAELDPIRMRHDELLADPTELARVLADGADRAAAVARPTLRRARAAFGLADRAADGFVILGPADAGEALTLQRAGFLSEGHAHEHYDIPPLRETLEELRDALRDPRVIALGSRDASGRLIGAVRLRVDGTEAEVGRLVVAPDRQGAGLATRLLAAAEARLPPEVTSLRLLTGERNVAALRLYARIGYAEVRREPLDQGYDLVHLRRPRHAGDASGPG